MPSETSCSFSNLPWSTRRHYIGALLQTGPPKMAVYSLTGNDNSPFHAEPAQGNTRQDRSTGSTIALQLVGDDPEWFLALTAQQSAKEPLGCTLIVARLQQNIDDITVLIRGTP
jgi:hypothetical protein